MRKTRESLAKKCRNFEAFADSGAFLIIMTYPKLPRVHGKIAILATSLSLLGAGQLEAALYVRSLNSVDRIVGQTQGTGLPLGYTEDVTGGLVGRSGSNGNRYDSNIIFGYTLPTLAVGESITAVTFNFEITGTRDHSNSNPELDVYLLNTANANSGVDGQDFYYMGTSDPNANVEFIHSEYIDVGTSQVNHADDAFDISVSLTGDALTVIQNFYGGDHIPDQSEVFFRFNLDGMTAITNGTGLDRYNIDIAADESSLEITTIPEPSCLIISAIGLITILRRRR